MGHEYHHEHVPVYLITLHAYRSWMPDRREGYVRRHKGILAPDPEMADQYRRNAKESETAFLGSVQRILIDPVLQACQHQRYRAHMIATDPSHVHVLVSWTIGRDSVGVRAGIKASVTRCLNRELGRRSWLSDGGSRKPVHDQEHFDYLVNEYLPSHKGINWREGIGYSTEPINNAAAT